MGTFQYVEFVESWQIPFLSVQTHDVSTQLVVPLQRCFPNTKHRGRLPYDLRERRRRWGGFRLVEVEAWMTHFVVAVWGSSWRKIKEFSPIYLPPVS